MFLKTIISFFKKNAISQTKTSLGNVFEIIHAEVQKEFNLLTVTELCELAGVSRSGYYNWIKSAAVRGAREERDRGDFELILKAYNYRGYAKGARSIHMRLLHQGIRMN